MPMTKAQRREYKAFLNGRRKVRKVWTEHGPKRRPFGDGDGSGYGSGYG